MAQTGFTPIQLYSSTTPAAAPVAGNLVQGELAINVSDTDMALYAENASGVVKRLINNPAGIKYPTADGTAGQYVQTDGSGNLSFVTPTVGSGTVSSVSVVTANGLAGTVANPTTTPAITLSTSITGLLKGNATAISAATAGTDYVTPTGTETLTNKRITPRANSTATTTSPWAWNSNSYDQQEFTALANALTINADAGTPTDGQKTIFRFQDNGTARALTWTTGTSKSFRAIGVTLPTTTVINKTVYIGCIYNSADARWDAVAVAQEA